ncbi:MAG: universal stress protein, partial [Cyanobacteria bacterium P01_E01_bin.34]
MIAEQAADGSLGAVTGFSLTVSPTSPHRLKVWISSQRERTVKRILVALDKSELSEVVFEEGVTLADAMGAQVLLLNVTSLFEGMSLGGDMPNLSLVLEHS